MVEQVDSQYLIFGIGNPLLDISVNDPEGALLEKYEIKGGLACLAEEKQMPIYKEIWDMEGNEKIPGGSALNTMRATAWMLKRSHPDKVLYQGSIGTDEAGRVLKEETEKSGLKGVFAETADHATGECAVVVHQKERALCANLSAALKYPLEHLDSNVENMKQAKILYSTCFFITSNYDALIKVGQYALESNKPFGLNLSATFLIQFEGAKVLEAMKYADYIFCNEDEADTFASVNNVEHTSRQDIAKAIAKHEKANKQRPRNVLITQGSQPIILATTNLDNDDVEIREIEIPALSQEQLVDTNGAGDSFVGGFLAQLAQDKPIDVCIKCGTFLSAQVI